MDPGQDGWPHLLSIHTFLEILALVLRRQNSENSVMICVVRTIAISFNCNRSYYYYIISLVIHFPSDMWVDPLLMMLCRATQSPLSLHVLVLVLSPRTPFWTHFYFFWCVTRTHFLYLFNFFVYSQSILHKYVTSLTTPFPSLIYEWTPSLCCYLGQPNIHSPSMCK